ncbi:ATP-binding cassette domain-containing protein, partial [Acinetobacter baumannii]
MSALLQVQGLIKRFGGLTATDNLNLEGAEGEIHALIGPNGAGKTTVFNLISAVLKPTSGTVRFDGRDITGAPTHSLARLGIART